jgi:hypothetical protein
MSCSLIFLENSDDIKLLNDDLKKDCIVIAMTPSVCIELKKRGFKYYNTSKFFGSNGHKNVIEKSSQIVEGLRPLLKELSSKDIKETFEKTWIFYFRFFLHYWLATIFIIHHAVKEFKPNKLIMIKANELSNLSLDVTKNNRILGLIVERYGEANNIRVQSINNIKINNIKFKFKFCSDLIKDKLGLIFFEFLLRIYPIIGKKRTALLVPDDSYNMTRFIGDVSKHIAGSIPVYLGKRKTKIYDLIRNLIKGNEFSFLKIPANHSNSKNRDFIVNLDICISQIQAYFASSQKLFNYFNVSLNDPLLEYTKNGIYRGMIGLHGQILSLKRVIQTINPKYVFSQHSLGLSYALGEYCSSNSIPALLISHASHVPHLGALPHLEWSIHAHTLINTKYPFIAGQSPWAIKFLKQQKGFESKVIETGPLLFAKKNIFDINYGKSRNIFRKFSNKKIFLHASSPRSWNVFRPFIYETFDEYIRNLTDLIKAVDSNPNIYLAIRFRPSEGLSLSDLKESLPRSSSYDIYVDGTFEQYLLESDMLISYSSTTIEEALQNHIPVLQYDPDGKYMHLPGQKLSQSNNKIISSVYSVYDKSDLVEAIGWLSTSDIHNSEIEWSKHTISGDDQMHWLDKLV